MTTIYSIFIQIVQSNWDHLFGKIFNFNLIHFNCIRGEEEISKTVCMAEFHKT